MGALLLYHTGLSTAAMRSRTFVRLYFTRKYNNPNPYSIDTADHAEQRYEDLLELIKSNECRSALDIGTGEGTFAALLSAVCEKVHGIDISTSAIRRAQNTFRSNPKLTFSVVDIVTDDLDETYDLVICSEVLYYLTPAQLRRVDPKLRRWVAPNGFLLLSNLNRPSFGHGLFRPKYGAADILRFLSIDSHWQIVSTVDRGNDSATLLQASSLVVGH